MIYLNEQLSKMNNDEVEYAVGKKLGDVYKDSDGRLIRNYERYSKQFNPTKSWNDVMPIAEKYKFNISLASYSVAVTWLGYKMVNHNRNIKRCICEVFLMMDIN